MAYPRWDPDQTYENGARVVHEGRLYLATEKVTRTPPDPRSEPGRGPWLLIDRHGPG